MKKFFSLVLALVMALSLTTVAWGATTAMDETDLKAAFLAGEDVVLGGPITLTHTSTSDWAYIPVGESVTLDLAGYTITRAIDDTLGAIRVLGELTIIDSVGGGGIADENYAIVVGWKDQAGPGAKLTINAGIFTGSGYVISGNGTVSGSNTTNMNTVITINDGTITGGDLGIYHPQVGTLNINGGTISGTDCGIEVRGGTINVTDGTITGGSGAFSANPNGNGATSKNAAIAIAQHTTKKDIEVNISGGTLTAGTALAETNAQNNDPAPQVEMSVTGGEFNGAVTVADAGTGFITGGEFSAAPAAAYVAPGYSLNTTTGVVSTTPAGGAADATLYFWDSASAKWLVDYIAAGKDIDDLKSDDSDDCLPCFIIDGDYYVEVSDSAATFKLVYGKKTVFLKDVPSTAVCYDDEVKALTVVEEDDAECGDYYYADDYVESTDYDADDTFYASYTKKGLIDKVYVADSKNGTKQVLVGTKLVKANVVSYSVNGDSQVVFMDHVWAGYEVVNYKYVSVICDECGNVAKLYANATAAGKKAVKVLDTQDEVMGWITFADATNYGSSAGTYVPTTPSTDKVQSADTFDAGIAMYVGMSVMAAAGSAVVLKKRED